MHIVASVTKNIQNVHQWKVLHMIHSNGIWINCPPPNHPKLNVDLSVAVDWDKRISKQAPPVTGQLWQYTWKKYGNLAIYLLESFS